MGQVIIRKLDDAVIAMAKQRAKSDGKSLEQYLRELITENIRPSKAEIFAKVDKLFEGRDFAFPQAPEDMIREDRDSR
jgi:plasmid stability protein